MPSISGVGVVPGLSVQDKQAALANEKRRRRRESHNAVERRRRDNINEKISELATLIPECMLDMPGVGPAVGAAKNGEGREGGVNGKSGGGGEDCNPTEDGPQSPLDVWVPKKEDGAVGAPGTSPPSASEGVEQGHGGKGSSAEGGVVKANKGMILRKSVEYIRLVFVSFFGGCDISTGVCFNHVFATAQVPPTTRHCAGCKEQRARTRAETVPRRSFPWEYQQRRRDGYSRDRHDRYGDDDTQRRVYEWEWECCS